MLRRGGKKNHKDVLTFSQIDFSKIVIIDEGEIWHPVDDRIYSIDYNKFGRRYNLMTGIKVRNNPRILERFWNPFIGFLSNYEINRVDEIERNYSFSQ